MAPRKFSTKGISPRGYSDETVRLTPNPETPTRPSAYLVGFVSVILLLPSILALYGVIVLSIEERAIRGEHQLQCVGNLSVWAFRGLCGEFDVIGEEAAFAGAIKNRRIFCMGTTTSEELDVFFHQSPWDCWAAYKAADLRPQHAVALSRETNALYISVSAIFLVLWTAVSAVIVRLIVSKKTDCES